MMGVKQLSYKCVVVMQNDTIIITFFYDDDAVHSQQ